MNIGLRVLAGLGAILVVGCGGSGSPVSVASNAPPSGSAGGPGASASPGGYWQGSRSDGGLITLLITESGDFHLVDADENQGSGTLSVGDTDEISSSFFFVTRPGSTFADGSTSATCSLSGTVSERQTMAVVVNCRTAGLLRTDYTATLSYSDIYERDSALDALAGNYQGPRAVLNIAGDGTVFSQDPTTACVVNGLASIIDSEFNAYAYEFTYSSCTGSDVAMNGVSFAGIAVIDDRVSPQQLTVVAIGNLDGEVVSFEGNFVSFVETLERL